MSYVNIEKCASIMVDLIAIKDAYLLVLTLLSVYQGFPVLARLLVVFKCFQGFKGLGL
jgi:hypothetical protein